MRERRRERGRRDCDSISSQQHPPPLLPPHPPVSPPSGLQEKEDFLPEPKPAALIPSSSTNKKQPSERQGHWKRERERERGERMSEGGRDGVNHGERLSRAGFRFSEGTPVFSVLAPSPSAALVVAASRCGERANPLSLLSV